MQEEASVRTESRPVPTQYYGTVLTADLRAMFPRYYALAETHHLPTQVKVEGESISTWMFQGVSLCADRRLERLSCLQLHGWGKSRHFCEPRTWILRPELSSIVTYRRTIPRERQAFRKLLAGSMYRPIRLTYE